MNTNQYDQEYIVKSPTEELTYFYGFWGVNSCTGMRFDYLSDKAALKLNSLEVGETLLLNNRSIKRVK